MITSTQIAGRLFASADTLVLLVQGHGGLSIQLTGTWVGTVQFEVSNDGSNWRSLSLSPSTGAAAASSATAVGLWMGNVAGASLIRVRCSAFTSGIIAVTLIATAAPGGGGSSGGGGGGAVTIADGGDVAEGATTDAAVTGDNDGTVSAKLRGLSKILADVWDSVNHWLKVSIQNTTLAVTQSGVWTVAFGPVTSGGCSDYHVVAAASNNAAAVKGSAGQVYGVRVFNNTTYPIYVKFFNKATAPTPGSDTVVATYGVQAGLARDVSIPPGFAFSTGIAVAMVKGIADSDNTSVAANDAVLEVEYK